MDLIRAGFLWVLAHRLRDNRLRARRLRAEARRLCGSSIFTYGTLWEITDELD